MNDYYSYYYNGDKDDGYRERKKSKIFVAGRMITIHLANWPYGKEYEKKTKQQQNHWRK